MKTFKQKKLTTNGQPSTWYVYLFFCQVRLGYSATW